jgi:hypothetical protein
MTGKGLGALQSHYLGVGLAAVQGASKICTCFAQEES